MVQWIENLLLVLTDSEGPGSNPLQAHFSQHYFFFLFLQSLFYTVNITQLNRRFSHVPNLLREVTAFRWDV